MAAILLLLTYVSYAYGWSAGLGTIAALCFVIWFALVFPQVHRGFLSAVRNIRGLQLIIVIMFLSSFIEGFFPNIAYRDWRMVQESPANPVNLTRSGLMGLAAFMAVFALLRRDRLAICFRGPLRWMFLYAAVAIISSSYASLPLVSAAKATEVMLAVGSFLVLTSLLYADDFFHSWNTLWFMLLLLLASVWVSALLFPSIGFLNAPSALFPLLQGAYPMIAPNTLGQLGASLAIVAFCRLLRTGCRLRSQVGMLWVGMLLFGLATLAASQARTSMVAVAIAMPVCLCLYRRLTGLTFVTLAAIAILIVAVGNALIEASGVGEIVSQFLTRGQSAELITSLSGRLDYWQAAWDLFWTAPFLGQGFYTAHRIGLNSVWGRLSLSTVDNTYLEVLLGIGIIGLFPLVMALVVLTRRIIQTLKRLPAGTRLRDRQIEMIGVLIIALVRSIDGPTFEIHGVNIVLLLVIMAFVQSIDGGRLARTEEASMWFRSAAAGSLRLSQLKLPS